MGSGPSPPPPPLLHIPQLVQGGGGRGGGDLEPPPVARRHCFYLKTQTHCLCSNHPHCSPGAARSGRLTLMHHAAGKLVQSPAQGRGTCSYLQTRQGTLGNVTPKQIPDCHCTDLVPVVSLPGPTIDSQNTLATEQLTVVFFANCPR